MSKKDNYINIGQGDRWDWLERAWFNFQVFASLWYIWLGVLIVLGIIGWAAYSLVYLGSHPELIGSWFGKLIAGFNQANP